MIKKSPFDVVKSRYVTEKSRVMEQLQYNSSNPSIKKCTSPKYVFLVNRKSNKKEIAQAIEEIYADNNLKVVAVNTVNVKPKARRVRGRSGFKSAFKKAIVTFEAGDKIEDKD